MKKGKGDCCLCPSCSMVSVYRDNTNIYVPSGIRTQGVDDYDCHRNMVTINSTNQRLYTGHTNSEHSFCY
jgi:hypothetical protein